MFVDCQEAECKCLADFNRCLPEGGGRTITKEKLGNLFETQYKELLDNRISSTLRRGDTKRLQKHISAAMPSELEATMESLILVFHRYASEEGGYYTVSRDKLKQLMKHELPGYLQAQKDPGVIDKMVKDLDSSGCGQINFEQFFGLIAGFSVACEKAYQMKLRKTQKK